jgi:plastocyanin
MLKSILLALLAGLLVYGGEFLGTAHAAVQPTVVTVQLANFNFTPAQLALRANTPTVLQLRNNASGGHNFSAPAFFAAARIDPASAALVRDGKVEIPGHTNVQVVLTPAAGQYPLKCSHTLHSAFGMKGTIFVR